MGEVTIHLRVNGIKRFLNNHLPWLGEQTYAVFKENGEQEYSGDMTAKEIYEDLLGKKKLRFVRKREGSEVYGSQDWVREGGLMERADVRISENGNTPLHPKSTHLDSLEEGIMPDFTK